MPIYGDTRPQRVKPLGAELYWGKMKTYLHILAFLTGMAQAVKIVPHGRQATSYPISIPWLLMTLWCKKHAAKDTLHWYQYHHWCCPGSWYCQAINQHGIDYHSQVNSLGPSDAIWRQKTGLTLAQVMACCLTAPSHYLNQCWLIISKV